MTTSFIWDSTPFLIFCKLNFLLFILTLTFDLVIKKILKKSGRVPLSR